MTEKVTLTAAEAGSTAWLKVRAHLEQRLADKRAKVESPRITDEERREHAIRIDEIKQFLAVERPQKKATDAG